MYVRKLLKARKRTLKGSVGAVPDSYTGLGTFPDPTSYTGKPHSLWALDTMLRGFGLSSGEISRRLNITCVLPNNS